MKHHRRKKLLKALNEMYLNNYRASATYSEQTRLLGYMTVVAENLARQDVPARHDEHVAQIPLFPELELFGA